MTWLDELRITATTTPHAVLTGSTWDYVISGSGASVRALSVVGHLGEVARGNGVAFLVIADPVRGFQMLWLDDGHEERPEVEGALAQLPGFDPMSVSSAEVACSPDDVAEMISRVAGCPVLGGLVVVDAARLIVSSSRLNPSEHALFTLASSTARGAVLRPGRDDRAVYSPVYWLCRTERELPTWYLADPGVRSVEIQPPSRAERGELGAVLLPGRGPELGDATDGLSTREVMAVARLVAEGSGVEEAATHVRLGVTDDPWTAPDLLDRLEGGEERLNSRVLGQERAVAHAWSAIQRSLMGLSGLNRPSSGRRPRIVLFLAGPTGTGKTELAKSLGDLIFGPGSSLLRFDMSGYTERQSDQRLIGAPPGYVGHEAGGELTNAVRARPFSVILFDEIEKAHPDILDKFLQILDEGHIDDGLGRRVYFDQSVIVFTSNLGVTELVTDGNVTRRETLIDASMAYDDLAVEVRDGIKRHFVDQLGRPEILNRIGDNLVVFDFIRPEAARAIFRAQIATVSRRLPEVHPVDLGFDDEALDLLEAACCDDLEFGGRGIANKVESLFLNPLGSWMFERRRDLPPTMRVTEWDGDEVPHIEVAG